MKANYFEILRRDTIVILLIFYMSQMFRDELVRQLESAFPVEVSAYLSHRQKTRPSSS